MLSAECQVQYVGTAAIGCPPSLARLPLRLAASHLLNFRLLRSARIIARLQRLVRLALLARGAFGFLTFVSAQLCCIGHETLSSEFVIW